MNMKVYYKNMYDAVMNSESEIHFQGKYFASCGFDKTESVILVKALNKFGYIHKENDGTIAVFVKEKKDSRFIRTEVVKIGKVLKGEHWFGYYDYSDNTERHTWLIGDTDYSNPHYPKTLTRMGWYTGD